MLRGFYGTFHHFPASRTLHYGGWPKKSITPGQPLAQPRISPTSLNYTAVQSLASKAEASKPTPPPAKPAEAAPKEAPKPKNEPPPQTPSPKKLEDKKAKAALNLAGPFPAPLYSNGTTVAGLQAEASKRSVGVFWDHENSQPDSDSSGLVVGPRLRNFSSQFGSVVELKIYASFPRTNEYRSELQSSGFSLIDCPKIDKAKDVADKMIIVDMFTFARLHPLSAIILITADKDFAYAISRLRSLGHPVILASRPTPPETLARQATLAFDLLPLIDNGNHKDAVELAPKK